MRSDIAAKAPENRRSQHQTPHNHALRIIHLMRCTALRRNRRSVVQAFRRESRLPLGQAGRSELQRPDLRQSIRRRGRRGLHAHLVPRPQTQWRLRPADEASPGKPGGAFGSPNRPWRRRAVQLTFSNSYPGRNCNAAFWPHVVVRERPRRSLAQALTRASRRRLSLAAQYRRDADRALRARALLRLPMRRRRQICPVQRLRCTGRHHGRRRRRSQHGRHQARRALALRRLQGERDCGLLAPGWN